MPRKPKRPPVRYPVSVTVNGKEYHGEYYVEGRPPIVYLVSAYGSKATQQGNSPAETIAGMMLGALVGGFRGEGA